MTVPRHFPTNLRRPWGPWGPAVLLLCVLALVLGAGGAWALSEQEVEERVLLLTDQLRCPTCQGLSVKDSDAPLSRQMEDKVRRMVKEGQSDEAIRAFFVSRYGEWILRAPKKEGLGLVLWALPIVGILAGLTLIGWQMRRNRQAATAATPADKPGLTPEQKERIARDMKRFEDLD